MSEMNDPADDLRRCIAGGYLSEDSLQAITNMPLGRVRYFLNETKPGMTELTLEPQMLSNDESARLSLLAAHLTEGLWIDDDDRLKAIFESLTIECRLTPRNIAKLTGLDANDVENALHDPRTVSIERKYELAIKGSYLINAANRARG
jgi:hypothetical protein